MKKFKFMLRGNKYDVELLTLEDNIAEIEVNGTAYQVEILKEVKTTKTPRLVRTAVVPSGESDRAKTSSPSEKKGAGTIKAPLPGTILEIFVKPGDMVKAGEKLMVMEAMKMENNILAHSSGKVVDIKIKAGDSVLEGDVLLEIGNT